MFLYIITSLPLIFEKHCEFIHKIKYEEYLCKLKITLTFLKYNEPLKKTVSKDFLYQFLNLYLN